MFSPHCTECSEIVWKFHPEIEQFYCYNCENYTYSRVKRWD
jgi:hypothetical protein